MAVPVFSLPGDQLCAKEKYTPGLGTHIHISHICASVAGKVSITAGTRTSPSTISILRATGAGSTDDQSAIVPSVGDVVLGRITRITPRQATVELLVLGITGLRVLHEPFQALIRQQDIRATETDKVEVSESFRVGDIVRGNVVSLGDERAYYLSTAKNEFGVVLAHSECGNALAPRSWKTMVDLETGIEETRKVAKVV